MSTVPRPICNIAFEIWTLWREKPPSQTVQRFAFPYLEAMMKLDTCADFYGLEYGDMIVAHFLNGAAHWGGKDAKRIKSELKLHLEMFNASHKGA